MKKITLLAVAFVAVSLASCKKEHTCTCTYGGSTYGTTTVIAKSSKSAAQAHCVSGTNTNSAAGSTAWASTCTLSK